MLAIALNGMWAYKRRLISSTLTVVLGVAFLSGTLLLGDTLKANFDNLFTQANAGTDVVVRGVTKIGSTGGQDRRLAIDASLVQRVRGVPGVADAQPYVEGFGQLLGHDGKRVAGNGPPTQAANWVSDASLNPYRLAQGRAPAADDEVVINRGAAKAGKLHLGDTTTLLTPKPVIVRIVGLSTFGTADGFGSVTFTGMTLPAAQRYLAQAPGRVSEVLVKAAPGVAPDRVIAALRQQLPAGVEAVTGQQLATEDIAAIDSGFLGFLRTALTAFAVVALLVAVFSIYNTFSIIAAQRNRTSALLRALGATRRQVIGSGMLEALGVGLVGSLAGWGAGIGIAAGLKGVFDGFGFALPAGGLVFKASSIVLAVGAGLAATLVAGVAPSVRSSRVAPVAALRDQAIEQGAASRTRGVVGAVLTAGGVAALVAAATRPGPIGLAGIGAVLTLVGMVVLGPLAARPAASVLGAPVAATRGVTGTLARGNAMRNPRRTAATASALLIGVAVVAMFTMVAASLKASAAKGVDRALTADLVVDTEGYGGGAGRGALDPGLATRLARLAPVQDAVGLGGGTALIDGDSKFVAAADPADIGHVVDLGVTDGSLAAMTPTSLAVSSDVADSHDWHVGSRVRVTYPDGAVASAGIVAIFGNADITGGYLFPAAGWTPHAGQAVDSKVLLELRPGADVAAAAAAVRAATSSDGDVRVQDRDQYRSSATAGVNTFLGMIYVMLALAILIALMGISNTLSLSIHERTRELGLLRAVGQTRAQARAMVRWESVLVAVFGTVGGVGLGTLLGWSLVKSASTTALSTFSAPPVQLAVFLVVGAIAGTLAGIRPARRAAKLRILQAISAE
jgi:putative ABC transport system permease protein